MLPTKFQFIWLRVFQRRRLKCEKLTDDGHQVMDKKSLSVKSSFIFRLLNLSFKLTVFWLKIFSVYIYLPVNFINKIFFEWTRWFINQLNDKSPEPSNEIIRIIFYVKVCNIMSERWLLNLETHLDYNIISNAHW
jgi:hypothetical protein